MYKNIISFHSNFIIGISHCIKCDSFVACVTMGLIKTTEEDCGLGTSVAQIFRHCLGTETPH